MNDLKNFQHSFSGQPATSPEILRDEIGIKWLPHFEPALFPFVREEIATSPMKSKDFRDGRIVVGCGLVAGRKTYRRFFYVMPLDFAPDAMERRDWISGAVEAASIETGKPARKATRENYEAAANLSAGQRKVLDAILAANRAKRRLIGPKQSKPKRCPKFPGASVVIFGERAIYRDGPKCPSNRR